MARTTRIEWQTVSSGQRRHSQTNKSNHQAKKCKTCQWGIWCLRSNPELKTARGKEYGVALLQGQGNWEGGIRKGIAICDGAARDMGRISRLKRQKDPKARKSYWYDHADFDEPGGPYQSRWGDNWKDHLPKSFTDVCITLIMDHVISEGNCLFADTPFAENCTIYHDALPQCWEKAAQDHIRMRGFWHQQWMENDSTNIKIHRRYRNRLMGDSPELMPLDLSLFIL